MSEHKKKKHKSGKSKELREIDGPREAKGPKEAKKAKTSKDPALPKTPKRTTAKPRAKKAPGSTTRKKTTDPEPIIHVELISKRAYFISEKRRAMGEYGDEHGDWIEAERQLRKEARQG